MRPSLGRRLRRLYKVPNQIIYKDQSVVWLVRVTSPRIAVQSASVAIFIYLFWTINGQLLSFSRTDDSHLIELEAVWRCSNSGNPFINDSWWLRLLGLITRHPLLVFGGEMSTTAREIIVDNNDSRINYTRSWLSVDSTKPTLSSTLHKTYNGSLQFDFNGEWTTIVIATRIPHPKLEMAIDQEHK